MAPTLDVPVLLNFEPLFAFIAKLGRYVIRFFHIFFMGI